MSGFPLLSLIIFTPAIGALLLLLVRGVSAGNSGSDDEAAGANTAYTTGIVISLATLVLTIFAFLGFDRTAEDYQFVEAVQWFGNVQYKLGVDGLSLTLILLTAFLTPICFLASWSSIRYRVTDYVVAFLLLESLMLGVFAALDLVLFYIFFEGGLIPMFIIIGIWGGKERVYAAFKFFLYTLLGSLFMLAAVIVMYLQAGTSDIVVLQSVAFSPELQTWLWLAFFASFAVKLPMWPVHTWLPDAHVQAPTAGSVILAGILLKMGGYGFLRFSLPMFPDASVFFQPFVFALSIIAIIYTSLVAFRQTDIKKLIAYSSVAHMGFVTLGIFSFNEAGVQGAIFQMISHGLISGALFLLVGVIYDRMHTREISFYGGLADRMPVYAGIFMVFTMANVGLPGTSGFVGEILTMTGAYQALSWAAVGAAVGVILSAVYMLSLYRRVVFGPLVNEKLAAIKDVNAIELLCLVPLLVLTVLFGIFPNLILDLTEQTSLSVLRLMTAG